MEEFPVKSFVDTVALFPVERQDCAGVPWQPFVRMRVGHDAVQIHTAVGSLKRQIFRTSSKIHGSGTGIFWLWWTVAVTFRLSPLCLLVTLGLLSSIRRGAGVGGSAQVVKTTCAVG